MSASVQVAIGLGWVVHVPMHELHRGQADAGDAALCGCWRSCAASCQLIMTVHAVHGATQAQQALQMLSFRTGGPER